MAFSDDAQVITGIAGSTFPASALYKAVVFATAGGAVKLVSSTADTWADGVLYSITSTTSSTGSQAVAVAVGGVVKLQMAASTIAAGNYVAINASGLGAAPSTDAYVFGRVIAGSSGSAGRIASVLINRAALQAAPSSQ